MAKFLPILGSLRGSILGSTWSRNKGGAYVKGKGCPINPNTSRQQKIRGILSDVSRLWQGLDVENQVAWNGYADVNPKRDPLGNEYFCTGHQYFVGLSLRLKDAGDDIVDTPPQSPVPQTAAGVAVTTADGEKISVAFSNTLAADERIVVWQSVPQEGAADPNFNQARMVGYSSKEAVTPVELTLPWNMTENYTANFWVGIQNGEGNISPVQKDKVTYTPEE